MSFLPRDWGRLLDLDVDVKIRNLGVLEERKHQRNQMEANSAELLSGAFQTYQGHKRQGKSEEGVPDLGD